jgi:hypothetical protein
VDLPSCKQTGAEGYQVLRTAIVSPNSGRASQRSTTEFRSRSLTYRKLSLGRSDDF